MIRKTSVQMTLVLLGLLAASCSAAPAHKEATPIPPGGQDGSSIANPASVFCTQNGGALEIRTDSQGGQVGFCIFPDASECEEWAYFRSECKPGDSLQAAPPASDSVPSGWKLYSNEELGYSFQYPADAAVSTADDPFKSLTINGPEVNGNIWPSITISHPADPVEYRLPEGTGLADWLVKHNLIPDGKGDLAAEARLEDIQIAGETAVHLRHDRSPQSFAHDRYYFSHSGQIYMIVIGHTGDKEDWQVYNHFLDSFQFVQAPG